MGCSIRNFKLSIINFLTLHGFYTQVRTASRFLNKYDLLRRRKSIKFFAKFIKKGDLCFDIGACFGDITQFFLNLGANVICVEPQKSCLSELNKRFSQNTNVKIVASAVTDKTGSAILSIYPNEPAIATISTKWRRASRFAENFKLSRQQKVTTITLDSLIKKYGTPKFCKIDIEGAESLALKGLTYLIPYISFEFTKEFLNDAWKNMVYLSKFGKARFNCMLCGSTDLLFNNWQTKENYLEN